VPTAAQLADRGTLAVVDLGFLPGIFKQKLRFESAGGLAHRATQRVEAGGFKASGRIG
jgi:hypothetical protein